MLDGFQVLAAAVRAQPPQRDGSLDGADDGRGLYGLDAVDGAEAVGDVVVQVDNEVRKMSAD